jgi:hypothetical protein
MGPEGKARLLNSLARMNSETETGLRRKVISRFTESISDSSFRNFSAGDIAIILNSIVRISKLGEELFRAASERLQSIPDSEFVSEKHLGLIFNAFARAGVIDLPLFASLSKRVESQLKSLSSQSCGNICHAFGRLGIDNAAAKELMSKVSLQLLSHKKPSSQEISNVFHSLSKVGIDDPEIIEPMLTLITQRILTFNPIEIAAVATAVSRMNVSDKNLMAKLKKRVESILPQFTSYELTAVLHAFSQLKVPTPTTLFEKVDPSIFHESNSHTACLALCAFARVGIVPSVDLSNVMRRLISNEHSGQYLVDVLFGLSRFETRHDSLQELTETVVERLLLDGFPEIPANVNQVIFALGKLGKMVPESKAAQLYAKTISLAIFMADQMDERQVSNMLFSMASHHEVSSHESKLIDALIPRIAHINNPQLLSSCIESAVKVQVTSSSFWNQMERKLRITIPESPLVDLRTSKSLAHIGRFRGEVAQFLLKRIDLKRLGPFDLVELVYTISYSKIKDQDLVQNIARESLNRIADMSAEEFHELASLLKLNEVKQFPFLLSDRDARDTSLSPLIRVQGRESINKELSATTELTLILDGKVSTNIHQRRNALTSYLIDARHSACPDDVCQILECMLVKALNGLDLSQLAALKLILSDSHNGAIVDECVAALDRGAITCDLRDLSVLMKLGNDSLKDRLTMTVLPDLVRASKPEEISAFIHCTLVSGNS